MNTNHVAGHGSDDFQNTVSEKLTELKRESQNLGKEIEERQNRSGEAFPNDFIS